MGTRFCPECDSTNIKYAGIVDGNFDLICRCLDCEHRWHQMKDQYIRDDSSKQTCPECGDSQHYRIIYTDDEMAEVKFYDCMMCYTHWDKDGKNLGKF